MVWMDPFQQNYGNWLPCVHFGCFTITWRDRFQIHWWQITFWKKSVWNTINWRGIPCLGRKCHTFHKCVIGVPIGTPCRVHSRHSSQRSNWKHWIWVGIVSPVFSLLIYGTQVTWSAYRSRGMNWRDLCQIPWEPASNWSTWGTMAWQGLYRPISLHHQISSYWICETTNSREMFLAIGSLPRTIWFFWICRETSTWREISIYIVRIDVLARWSSRPVQPFLALAVFAFLSKWSWSHDHLHKPWSFHDMRVQIIGSRCSIN